MAATVVISKGRFMGECAGDEVLLPARRDLPWGDICVRDSFVTYEVLGEIFWLGFKLEVRPELLQVSAAARTARPPTAVPTRPARSGT